MLNFQEGSQIDQMPGSQKMSKNFYEMHTPHSNRRLQQKRGRRLKCISIIIHRLFPIVWLTKRVPTLLELNLYHEWVGDQEKKYLSSKTDVVHITAKQIISSRGKVENDCEMSHDNCHRRRRDCFLMWAKTDKEGGFAVFVS